MKAKFIFEDIRMLGGKKVGDVVKKHGISKLSKQAYKNRPKVLGLDKLADLDYSDPKNVTTALWQAFKHNNMNLFKGIESEYGIPDPTILWLNINHHDVTFDVEPYKSILRQYT